jgi:outer membrane protein OmpA-like peptidoglycan-associated protein
MLSSRSSLINIETKRVVAILATTSLAVLGLTGLSSPAYAGTNVDVFYSGNSIGTPTPSSLTVDRDVVPLLAASSVTGSRTNYSFGGWSLTAGGAALTGSTYAFSSTATRLDLYAVWNTTVNYNTNGADSGSPAGNTMSETYRLGETLTLPTVGTMVKSGYAFGGWMSATVSTTRSTTYTAAAGAVGAPTLYAAWIKTVTFNSNTATSGSIPGAQVYVAGGTALKLPVASEVTLRKSGYEFAGWSTSATGNTLTNPGTYVPLISQQTLYAIWRVQSTKATARVFFNPGKSVLRAAQKLVIRDMVDSLRGKTSIKISLAATRARSNAKSLGKARNTAVVNYLNSLGVVATYTRTNTIGTGLSTGTKSNRVTISATWTNPAS